MTSSITTKRAKWLRRLLAKGLFGPSSRRVFRLDRVWRAFGRTDSASRTRWAGDGPAGSWASGPGPTFGPGSASDPPIGRRVVRK
jgi:hypothetical protein